MVKADPQRDYYADLEIPPTADVLEIKKQFKKLALKYHPDRNPGHEEEFSPKFQAIGAAHEVLSDPLQKVKYDRDRLKLASERGYAPRRPNVPSRNPYTAYSDYPPPPRPPPPPSQPTRPTNTNASSSAANRYSSFARAFGNSSSKEDANAKTNAFRAWENMNKSARGTGQASNQPQSRSSQRPAPAPAPAPAPPPPPPPPPPPAASHAQASPFAPAPGSARGPGPNVPPTPTRPKPKFTEANGGFPAFGRSQTMRSSKKQGFAPGTPGGDEPAAPKHTSYFSNRGGRPMASRLHTTAETPPQPPPPAPQRPDPLDTVRAQNSGAYETDTARARMPYSRKGGERTQLSSAPLGRSATHREPPPKTGRDRHRSFSPPRSRAYVDGDQQSGFRTGPSSPTRTPPTKRTNSDAGIAAQREYARSHIRPPSTGRSTESEYSSEGKAGSTGESPTYMERLAQRRQERGRHKGRSRQYPECSPPFYQPLNRSTDASHPHRNQGPPKSNQPHPFAPHQPSSSRQSAVPDTASQSATEQQGSGRVHANGTGAKQSFTFPLDDEMFESTSPGDTTAQTRRPDNPNAPFAAADWAGTFKSDGQDYFNAPPSKGGKGNQHRSPLSPARNLNTSNPMGSTTHSAAESQQPSVTNGAPHIPPPGLQDDSASPGQGKFSTEHWSQVFREPNWIPPPQPSASSAWTGAPNGKRQESRSKGSRSGGGSKSSMTRARVPRPPEVTDESDEEEVILSDSEAFANLKMNSSESLARKNQADVNAMEIDSDTPPRENHHGVPPVARSTHAPDQSAGDRQHTSETPRFAPMEPDHLDLGNMRKVEPLANPKQGLKDMNDLSDNLPFESRASTSHPRKLLDLGTPEVLHLPRPPRAPDCPSKASLSQSSWEQYMANMRPYLHLWARFTDTMLGHFNARQEDIKEKMAPNWIGDLRGGEQGGFLQYMIGLKEDLRAREHWSVACEKHAIAMNVLGEIRIAAVQRGLTSA
ncbi:MAG: hypothetical protein M1837_001854 [Sclerophora amabilis]|nr:MAG: hypothetical protein M1837_001854 [Sclerophora amabilis]